jgi:hypothetical protein
MQNRSSIHYIKSKIFSEYDKISTSYHEVGHIICAIYHYLKPHELKIFKEADNYHYEGIAVYESYSDFLSKARKQDVKKLCYSEISISYAGTVAERLLFSRISGKNKLLKVLHGFSTEDFKEVNYIINKYNLAKPGRLRKRLKSKITTYTENVLTTFWQDVELLSYKLISKGSLKEKEIRSLLVNESTNKKVWTHRYKVIDQLSKGNVKPK